jgi:hypothetical protein
MFIENGIFMENPETKKRLAEVFCEAFFMDFFPFSKKESFGP